jgi:DUF1365 family protein
MAVLSSRLYFGHVMHQRLKPFRHGFRYRVFTLFLDLDELDSLGTACKILSHNRFNVFGIDDRDHAARDGAPIRPWVEKHARDKGIDLAGGKIFMLCFPRLFGYVFNPLTIYFCKDRDGRLAALLYEVKNTFGEQHGYLLTAEEGAAGAPVQHSHDKHFYVSPFIEMKAAYHFTVKEPGGKLSVMIRQKDDVGDDVLLATWTGRKAPLSTRYLLLALVLFPFQAFHVMLAIHWQALKIWLKGGRYYSRPRVPEKEVS